ncbi:hypothetical protein COOONC_09162 [Cooperia oncophora]
MMRDHGQKKSSVCSSPKKVRSPTKSVNLVAPSRRKPRKKKKVKNNSNCGTASPLTPAVVQASVKSRRCVTNEFAKHEELPWIAHKENASKKIPQSASELAASELALMEFAEIWKGLVAKAMEKIKQGNLSQKARTDIGQLRDCALRLCETGDVPHLEKLVTMSTTLLYFYTFDPSLENLIMRDRRCTSSGEARDNVDHTSLFLHVRSFSRKSGAMVCPAELIHWVM